MAVSERMLEKAVQTERLMAQVEARIGQVFSEVEQIIDTARQDPGNTYWSFSLASKATELHQLQDEFEGLRLTRNDWLKWAQDGVEG